MSDEKKRRWSPDDPDFRQGLEHFILVKALEFSEKILEDQLADRGDRLEALASVAKEYACCAFLEYVYDQGGDAASQLKTIDELCESVKTITRNRLLEGAHETGEA